MTNNQQSTFGIILDNTTFLKVGSLLFPKLYYAGLSYGREKQNLSNFIEALVLHDRIYLDQETLDMKHPMVLLMLEKLKDVIKWQDYSTISRLEILKRSRELAESRGNQGVFIEIINQIPNEFWNDYYRDEINTFWPNRDYYHLVFEGISFIDDYLESEMSVDLEHHYNNDKFLSKFPNFFPRGLTFDWPESKDSNIPSLHNILLPFIALIIRGYFHLITSIETGIPYQPLAARAPFIHHELYYSVTKMVFIRQVLLREFEKIRSKISYEANHILQSRVFETEVPLVLAYIMKISRNRNEILDRALELRESKNVVRYRNYCDDLQHKLVSEDIPPSKVIKIKCDMERIANEVIKKESILERTSISIGIPIGISLGLPITRWGKKKGLLFLYDLQSVTKSMQSLDAEYKKLFGRVYYRY
jgi:hypothetical protein